MKKTLQCLCILAMIVGMHTLAYSQNEITVTGRVTSADDGSALPGVSVVEKGTSKGTTTDANGRYQIQIASDGTLVFSFIGMTNQEVAVGNRTSVDVQLATDIKALQEVVVTAQGISRERRALGYAVSNLGSERVTQISEPDPLRAIQGKIAGVNVIGASGVSGSASRITIRGNSSLTGQNQPLLVVDGIPFDNSFNTSATQSSLVGGSGFSNRGVDIDPNNIETYTILKGAAAAALYGTRAANGVILITTKSGSSKARKGLGISLSSSYSVERIANLPKLQHKYGAGANFNYLAANGSWGPAFGGQLTDIPHPYWGADYRTALPELQGVRVPYQAYPDNVKDFFQTGHVWENALTISGGNEKSSITSVISRTDQKGMIPNNSFDRTSVSVGGNSALSAKLSANANLTYTNTNQVGPILGANNAIGSASVFGRTLWLPRNFDLQGWPYQNPVTNASLAGWLTGAIDNPIWSTENNKYTNNVDRLNGYIGLGYKLNSWLDFNYKIGVNTYNDRRRTTIRPGSVSAVGNQRGGVLEDNYYWQEIESNFLITASRNIGEQFDIKATVGHNFNQRYSDRDVVEGTEIITFGIDNIRNTQNVRSVTDPAVTGIRRQRLIGVYGDVQVGFNNYLFLNLTGRNDWSSTLPKGGNSFFYPSVGTSFVFSDAFKLPTQILNLGKIRASWARVGNAPLPYNLIPTYEVNPGFGNVGQGLGVQFPFLNTPGTLIGTTIADPNLKPEFTSEIELGTELRFLNDRIGIDFTYYTRSTTNQLGFVTVPSATGYTSKYTNFGEITNRGIEVSLDLTPIKYRDFTWNILSVFTRNRNIVQSLTEGIEQIVIGANFTGGTQAVHVPGQPYGVMFGSGVARDPESGKVLINSATGFPIIDAVNRKVLGDPNPQWLLGITNSFSYKGFTLSALLDIKYGGDIYSTTVQNMLFRGTTTDTEDREKLLVIDGVLGNTTTRQPLKGSDGKTIPNTTQITVNNYYFGGVNSDEYTIFDASWIRLREISLGYTLPTKWLSRTPIGSARLSISGRNLWLYTPNIPKGTRFDPETSTFGASNVQGFEFTNAPTSRRYGINLLLSF